MGNSTKTNGALKTAGKSGAAKLPSGAYVVSRALKMGELVSLETRHFIELVPQNVNPFGSAARRNAATPSLLTVNGFTPGSDALR